MRSLLRVFSPLTLLYLHLAAGLPTSPQLPLHNAVSVAGSANVSIDLFAELEELARIVDISYCVGTTGIQKPFQCLGRCGEFEGFELVDVGLSFFLKPR